MAIDSAIGVAERARLQFRSIDQRIAFVSGTQHGVIARRQLLELGVSSAGVQRRCKAGRLFLLHPGVYAVGDRTLPPMGPAMAAVLALGPGSVASHRCAGNAWRFLDWDGWPEVTVPAYRRSRPGLIIHTGRLLPDEVTVRAGLPLTTPARTIIDLAAVLDRRALRGVLNEAHSLGLNLSPSLPKLVQRHAGRRGIANLHALLAEDQTSLGVTRSEFEARFFPFLVESGLPLPRINYPITVGDEVFTVDFAWPAARLIVETDGDAFHSTPSRRAADKRRDRRLRAIGWSVIRVAWQHLESGRAELLADLAAVLTPQRPRPA